jgi:hypothetical protein
VLDLIAQSKTIPQVTEGWKTTYVVFAHEGFTNSAISTADELGIRLCTPLDRKWGRVPTFEFYYIFDAGSNVARSHSSYNCKYQPDQGGFSPRVLSTNDSFHRISA